MEKTLEYVKKHKLHLDESLIDEGVSGFRGKNLIVGQLNKFYQWIESGRVQKGSTLIVESLDRLSRDSVTVALTAFLQIINAGVRVVTLMDGMTYSTESINSNPGSLMLSLVIMMRANEESDSRSKRIAHAWKSKREEALEKGVPMTSRLPAWLSLTGEEEVKDRKWIVNEERAALVKRIFTMSAKGMGKRTIAKILIKEGIPAWGDGRKGARKADGWHDSYIQKILRNEAVIGRYQPHWIDPETRKRTPSGEAIENYFPKIIPMQLWEAAQEHTRPPGPRSERVSNLFSGLLVDGYTGRKMRFISKGEGRGHGKYLVSDANRFPGVKAQTWPYPHFEEVVLRNLVQLDWSGLFDRKSDGKVNDLLEQKAKLKRQSNRLKIDLDAILANFGGSSKALREAATRKAAALAAELEKNEAAESVLDRKITAITRSSMAIGDEVAAFKELIKKGAMKERLQLQSEIRRRIKSITLWRNGCSTDFPGTPIAENPMPSITILFQNEKKKFIHATIPKANHFKRLTRDSKGRITGIRKR